MEYSSFKSIKVLGILMCVVIAVATAPTAVIAGQIPYGSGTQLSGETAVAAGWANDDYMATVFQDGTLKYFTAQGDSTNVNLEFGALGLGSVASSGFDVRGTTFVAVFFSFDGQQNNSVAVMNIGSIDNPKYNNYNVLFNTWENDFPIRVALDPTGPRFVMLLSRSGQLVLYDYDSTNVNDSITFAAKTTKNFPSAFARPVFRDDGKIYHASYLSILLLKREGSDLVVEKETFYDKLAFSSFVSCIAVQKTSPYNAVIVVDDPTYSLPYFVTTNGTTGTFLQGPRSRGVVTGVLGPVGKSTAEDRLDVCEISDDGRYLAFGSLNVEGFDALTNPPTNSFVSPFANNDAGPEKDMNFVSIVFRPSGDVFLVASVAIKEGQPPVSYIASYQLQAQASPTAVVTPSPTPTLSPSPTLSTTVTPTVTFTSSVSPKPAVSTTATLSPSPSSIATTNVTNSPSPSPSSSSSPSPSLSPNPSLSPSPSVTVTSTPSGDSVCFPGSAWVTTCSGDTKLMGSVQIGDCVQVRPDGTQSTVFMWGHHSPSKVTEFVHVEYRFQDSESGSLVLSPDHYLYVHDTLVRAADVRIGDKVRVLGDYVGIVTEVSRTKQVGLYHPHTLHGDIMVNGVHVSTFAAILPVWFQYTVLGVFRWMYLTVGSSRVYNEYLSGMLDEGSVIRPILLKMLKWVS